MSKKNFINLHLQLSKDDVERIDTWKADNGMRSRSEAIRHMIKVASGSNSSLGEKSSLMITNKNSDSSKEDIENLVKKMVKKELEKKLKN